MTSHLEPVQTTLAEQAHDILPGLVALRRELHQCPEIGLELPQTQQLVLGALTGLPLQISTGSGTTSVVGVLRGAKPGPAVLLRGDMDGLPVTEDTGLDYASTNGAMHACGHDLHTAGLVGAARLLSARREELAGSVVFMFQPGEEGYAGAQLMLEEGLLEAAGEQPVAAYAIHVCPGVTGTFEYRPGPILAGSNVLNIKVTGAGGHGSQPHQAKDPVAALIAIADQLQTMVTRRFDVFDPVVLSITQLTAGEAVNVIPETARLGATVRTLSSDSVQRLRAEATQLAQGVAAGHGCTAKVELIEQYPVTINDPAETAWAIGQLTDEFGADRMLARPDPLMGSEDFSYVLQQVPGAFLFLHCSPPEIDQTQPVPWNHSPQVVFDDSVLADQSVALARLALARLGTGETPAAGDPQSPPPKGTV